MIGEMAKLFQDELDDDYNRNHHSIGSVTLGVPLANAGKSSSLNSLHSEGDAVNGGGLDHDDVVTLAYDVRRFSEALARLKGVVSNSESKACLQLQPPFLQLLQLLCVGYFQEARGRNRDCCTNLWP